MQDFRTLARDSSLGQRVCGRVDRGKGSDRIEAVFVTSHYCRPCVKILHEPKPSDGLNFIAWHGVHFHSWQTKTPTSMV